MDVVTGFTAAGFEGVRDAFLQNFRDGLDVGASLCVEHEGQIVVDLSGGYQDMERSVPWQPETLITVFSATKGIAAIAFARLIEAQLISYEQPVREIWPELEAAQEQLTIGDLLAHRAGLAGFADTVAVSDLYDWQGIIDRLTVQTPLWQPGSAAGYHVVTWGYLMGEVVRRVAGITLSELIRDDVSSRLDADFFLGLPESEDNRVAPLISANRAQLPAEPGTDGGSTGPWHKQILENPVIRPYGDAFSTPWRRAEIAASNGHASARGIARIYGALLNGETLLRPESLSALLKTRVDGEPDLVLNQPIRRGAGIILNSFEMLGPQHESFGHPGAGGSIGFADPVNKLAVGYVMNQMLSGSHAQRRQNRFMSAIYRSLRDRKGQR
jgi:CubicO group peptidase (beta-lactamase class C family)